MKNVIYCARRRHCDFKNEENMCIARDGDKCGFSYTPITKPALGVMTRELWNKQRQKDLEDAMTRYLAAGMKIPSEWIEEYDEISEKEMKEMKKDEMLVKLYNSNIRQAVSKKYKECLAEEGKLVKTVDELVKLLESEEGANLPWREHVDKQIELTDCREKRDEIRIACKIWKEVDDLCLNTADDILE